MLNSTSSNHTEQFSNSIHSSRKSSISTPPTNHVNSLLPNDPSTWTINQVEEWLKKNSKVALGSDAFFPFGDNIERAHKSGVDYIAQAGGSVRDDNVIDTCDKYGITMAFTGIRLFHH